jgi:hypothetical protein
VRDRSESKKMTAVDDVDRASAGLAMPVLESVIYIDDDAEDRVRPNP